MKPKFKVGDLVAIGPEGFEFVGKIVETRGSDLTVQDPFFGSRLAWKKRDCRLWTPEPESLLYIPSGRRKMALSRYDQELTDACTSEHPDHRYSGQIRGVPMYWTAWCSICEHKGYNSNGAHNKANADMTSEHVKAITERAQALYAEQLAQPPRARKLPRCICPTCGTEHINRTPDAVNEEPPCR